MFNVTTKHIAPTASGDIGDALEIEWETASREPQVEFSVDNVDGSLRLFVDEDTNDTGSDVAEVTLPDAALPAIIAYLQAYVAENA